MSVVLDGGPATGRATGNETLPRQRARPRRHGEPRRPPTRARVVAGRGRAAVPDCPPRRVLPRWPWLVAAAVVVGLFFTGLGAFAGEMSGGVPERTATVTVGGGQSLWDIAREYAPSARTADVVLRIKQLNGLADATLVPGLPLTVPVGAPPPGDGR